MERNGKGECEWASDSECEWEWFTCLQREAWVVTLFGGGGGGRSGVEKKQN